MNRRIISTALAALMLLPVLLCSCTGDKTHTGSDTTEVTTDSAVNDTTPKQFNEYTVVRPDNDKLKEAAYAVSLRTSIRDICGFEPKIDNDADQTTNPDGNPYCPMILVGHTTFDETKTVLESFVTAKDFAIVFTDTNKIVITGGSASATEKAVVYFAENYLKQGSAELASRDNYRSDGKKADSQAEIKVVSLNLRGPKDSSPNTHDLREPRIAAFLQAEMPDSIGTQESEKDWYLRLERQLVPYGYASAPEVIPTGAVFKNYIWYNAEKLSLIDSGIFWLSETPEISSKGFGSDFYLSCCWAIFEVKATGTRYVHMNTHLDAYTESIREKELTVLIPRIKQFLDKDYAVLITGDFNSKSDSPIYSSMTGVLGDSRTKAASSSSSGTFNNYKDDGVYYGPIDYCFINKYITANSYTVVDKQDGQFMSDHNALVLKLTLFRLER